VTSDRTSVRHAWLFLIVGNEILFLEVRAAVAQDTQHTLAEKYPGVGNQYRRLCAGDTGNMVLPEPEPYELNSMSAWSWVVANDLVYGATRALPRIKFSAKYPGWEGQAIR